ncbi:MAG: class 1 fructose-bisphosphatase [Deltaproteobacteria bacterium]|nr:class 1 fructose-bisphosphatase [Deltaproteobacteria bacterium]
MDRLTTLTQHIRDAQLQHPGASGELSSLLTQIGVAGKLISSKVNMAGLVKIRGSAGTTNIQGEVQHRLDQLAEQTIRDVVGRSGYVCALMSEEEEEVIEIDEAYRGRYVVAYDPLDGSSNIDYNVSIGTIFSIFRKVSPGDEVTKADLYRCGTEQVAAGYIIYGSSTVFVYTVGQGVHGFTLDPTVGEYILSHEDIRLPSACKVLSVNTCNGPYWSAWVHDFLGQLLARNDDQKRRLTDRHIGSLVADFHRNLLMGGIFLYPEDARSPKGKLRLMYEANPLAFIIEQAGGSATNGRDRILEIEPEWAHHRVPLVIGNSAEVELARRCVLAASGNGSSESEA